MSEEAQEAGGVRRLDLTDRITLSLPKGSLARPLGASPETLSRVFSRLDEEGIIGVEDGRQSDQLLNLEEAVVHLVKLWPLS